jgi:hypothetical protein
MSLVTNSIGVYAENKDQIVLDDVEIKRFATGIHRKGGQNAHWFELFISDCTNGYKAHGDNASGAGGMLAFNTWTGGLVELCSGKGIELKNVDLECKNNISRRGVRHQHRHRRSHRGRAQRRASATASGPTTPSTWW